MNESLKKGAVWHGPWSGGLIGHGFGNPGSLHFAMTNGRQKRESLCTIIQFFPFTSKKNNHPLLILPPGTVSWGDSHKTSYLLKFRLLTTVEDLDIRFKYKSTLPEEIFEEFEKNYKKMLKDRKKKK